ncbi:uncharacterized protein BO87DRAFT_5687 [Aspergillus neoniger CBS 115656]|uniref:Uncharacterized protein n=1 Tax=Aspergillus neoniger (strain CBS 115656) TaxID=1448310 RepID=A0A318YYS2_ASPNB|nr:hypothetical protein BO87DRAFT_5687 [Aspergillus neoniger CBS 115656]PYH39729.1 hypothetical protein BO87DRAFT_5687 [Aspergillus neoniger CBS 115656]
MQTGIELGICRCIAFHPTPIYLFAWIASVEERSWYDSSEWEGGYFLCVSPIVPLTSVTT